jgi:hypothetical protein
MSVEGHQSAPNETLVTNEEVVTDRYFDTVGLRIVDGRGFIADDRNPAIKRTVINQTMARRFFPGQSAVGKRWSYGPIDKNAYTIVGVVADAHYLDIRKAPPNMVYHLADATPDDVLSDIEIRTAGTPGVLAQTMRDTIAQAEPRLPIVEVLPLGADRRTVLVMIMREALVLVVAGLAIGLPMAFAAGQSVGALLFGVNPADPLAFAAGAILLFSVAALAAYLPAYRASRIEPMVALGR